MTKPDGADTSPCAIATSILFDKERRMYACGVGVTVTEERRGRIRRRSMGVDWVIEGSSDWPYRVAPTDGK